MRLFCYLINFRLIVICIIPFTFFSSIQSQNLDSLEMIIKSNQASPSEKIRICDDLSWNYLSVDFEKAKHYALIGIETAQNENDLVMTGTIYRNLGVAYYMVSKLDSANIFLDIALEFAKKANDESLEAVIHSARANLYNLNGNYKEALFYYHKALPIFEKNNNKFKVRRVLGNIGTLYSSLQNVELAEKYYLLSEKLSLEINDPDGLTQAYNGLGNLYSSKQEYKKALLFSTKAMELAHEIGDIQTEALSYQTISEVYYAYYKDYTKAEEFAKKGLKLSEELGFPANIAAMLTTLSNVYYHKGEYERSMEFAIKAINTDTTDMNAYGNMADNLVRAGIQIGDIKIALHYFDTYLHIIECRSDKEYLATLNEMEVKYETEKKELRLIAIEKEKRLLLILAILGMAILILIIILLFIKKRSESHKKKLAEQKIIQFEQEKKLIATQAVLEGENIERSRLARDLHDGLGGMLSVVKLNLVNMKGNAILSESDVPTFQNALEMLDKSISELRLVARNLMPESLMKYGLKTAFTDFCSTITTVQFHFYGSNYRYNDKYEIATYRCMQELVNNAIKHAKASQINVQLIADDNRIDLVVQDNGIGFNISEKDNSKTTGLNSIRSRVESLNGKIDFITNIDSGTEIHINFNIKPL